MSAVAASVGEHPGELRPWTVVDQYRIVRLLGRGGMGEVYLARDAYLGRLVALKLLLETAASSPEWVRMFLEEAQAIAKLSHPNIVTVYGIGQHETRPYLSLEYVEGVTLKQRALHERLSLREVVHVGRSLALALDAAHAKGIVHRDLKPGNVLIGVDGRVRVLDFGVAKLLAQSPTERLLAPPRPATALPKKRVGTPPYMAPEQWRGEESTPSDVWALGVILHEIVAGHRPYPDRDSDDLARMVCSTDPVPVAAAFREVPPALRDLTFRCLEKDPARRARIGDVKEAFEALAIRGQRPRRDDVNPFRGLLPFTERHSDLFYGREPELAAFLERLRHGVVFPVVGPSGVGKSSFVRAGVIPRLREHGSWLVIRMRPLGRPLLTLAARLRGADETHATSTRTVGSPHSPTTLDEPTRPDLPPVGLDGGVTSEPRGIVAGTPDGDLALRLLETPELLSVILADLATRAGQHVLLLVDQLEEVLTLTEDEAERRAFMDALCTAAFDPQEPVKVILTLRDDFLGRIPWGKGASEALGNVTLLRTPGREALRDVITRPLASTGYRFEDEGLATEILESFSGEAASLPLLQFALRKLWDRRDREARVLTRNAYGEMGAVGGALAEHADQVLAALRPGELALARDLLLRLVTPEKTRRMVSRARLLEELAPEAAEVLDRLVKARLLALHRRSAQSDTVDVELAHDSLTATWGTLSRWIDESHEELRALTELTEAAELWERHGRRQDQLWEGDALRDAERTLKRTAAAVPNVVSRFVAAGTERQQRVHRHRRRLRAALVAMSALVAIAAVLAAWALAAREQEAVRGQASAEQGRAALLEEGARAALARDQPLEAAAKLRTALQIRDSAALRVLWSELTAQPLVWRYLTSGIVYDVACSPDGRLVAAANQSGLVHLMSPDGVDVRRLRGHDDQVLSVDFSPDSSLVAASTWSGQVAVWDTRSGKRRALWRFDAGIPSLSFSGDGRMLAAARFGGGVYVTDVGTGAPSPVFARDLGETWSVAFAPSGDLLMAAGASGSARLLHARGGAEARRFEVGAPVDTVAFSPRGDRVAASTGGKVLVWEVGGGPPVRTIEAATEKIRSLVFSPDGALLATGSYDRSLKLWDVRTGALRFARRGAQGPVASVAFAPGGDRLVAAQSHAVEMLRLTTGRHGSTEERIPVHNRSVSRVAFDPAGSVIASTGDGLRLWDAERGVPIVGTQTVLEARGASFFDGGRRMVTSHEDGIVRTWDTATGRMMSSFDVGSPSPIQAMAYHPSVGVVVGLDSGNILIIDAAVGRVTRQLAGHSGRVNDVVIADDGREALSVGRDGTARAWDLTSGEGSILLRHGTSLRAVALSPDGGAFALSGEDGVVMLLDRASATVRSTFRLDGRGYALRYTPDGRRLVVACSDGNGYVIDLETGRRVTLRGHRREVNSLALSPEGERVATVSDDSTVRLFRVSDGRPLWHGVGLVGRPLRAFGHRGWRDARGVEVAPPDLPWARVVEEARLTSQDAEGICAVTFDERLVRWDLRAARPALEAAAGDVTRVLAAPRGCLVLQRGDARLVTPTGDRRLAEAATAIARSGERMLIAAGAEVLVFDREGRQITTTASEPGVTALYEGRERLVLGFGEGTIVVRPLNGDDGEAEELQDTPVSGVAVMADGPMSTLVVGFENGLVGLWDLSTGMLLSQLRLHGVVTDVAHERGVVVAATDLGDQGTLDVGAAELTYCALLRAVWAEIPFEWQGGAPVRRAPPDDHRCPR